MSSQKILNCQESAILLYASTKKVWKLIEGTVYVCVGVLESLCVYIERDRQTDTYREKREREREEEKCKKKIIK